MLLSTIRMLLEVRSDTEDHFLFDTVILGYLTILKNCQPSSTFEAVNSTWPSNCQRDVRPLFELRWRPRAFCRVSTVDSDILSSCDMNDEHAWSLSRDIWPSFESGRLGVHFVWSIKHWVLLTYIFLRENYSWGSCGKMAYLFIRSRNQLSSSDDMVCPGFSSCCFTEIDVPIDLRWVSQGISGLL